MHELKGKDPLKETLNHNISPEKDPDVFLLTQRPLRIFSANDVLYSFPLNSDIKEETTSGKYLLKSGWSGIIIQVFLL